VTTLNIEAALYKLKLDNVPMGSIRIVFSNSYYTKIVAGTASHILFNVTKNPVNLFMGYPFTVDTKQEEDFKILNK